MTSSRTIWGNTQVPYIDVGSRGWLLKSKLSPPSENYLKRHLLAAFLYCYFCEKMMLNQDRIIQSRFTTIFPYFGNPFCIYILFLDIFICIWFCCRSWKWVFSGPIMREQIVNELLSLGHIYNIRLHNLLQKPFLAKYNICFIKTYICKIIWLSNE